MQESVVHAELAAGSGAGSGAACGAELGMPAGVTLPASGDPAEAQPDRAAMAMAVAINAGERRMISPHPRRGFPRSLEG